jgi:hypothetical protein
MCFEAALCWNKSCAFKCERKGKKNSLFILYINYSLHINLKKKKDELAKE